MFVYNLKVNGNIVFKVILFSIIIVALIILILSVFNIYSKSNFNSDSCVPTSSITNISTNQYTNILKEVYDNPDNYVGQSINFTGYVYRLSDMKDNEFVLARDMLINSDSQSVVVGFLCNSKDTNTFKNGTWVNVSGNIVKGYYHNQIPVIEITQIKEAQKPDDCFVYPPDSSYIPTSRIM